MSTRPVAALALLVALASLGCPATPLTRYYVLGNPAPEATRAALASGLDIGVRPFEVDPPYDQDRIVYRLGRDGAEVGFYSYHRWAAPLERMLPRLVAARLSGTPGLRSIEPAAPGSRYDVWLAGRVLGLEEIDHEAGQDVEVRIELALERPDGSRIWSESRRRVETIDTREVGAIVGGLNRVVAAAVDELREPLSRALAEARQELDAGASGPADHSW